MASPILVTGGTGRLGRLAVQRLREAGSSVRVLARQGRDVAAGVEFVRSDLRLGSGLDAAVAGASVIVHCATSTKGDVEAMQNLVCAANQTGLPHLVYVSIVGIDAIASWGYPKSKLQAEAVLVNSELPWTILRATQFHEYVLAGLQKLVRSPVVPVPAGFRVQPVDTAAVARRLVELALEAPSGRVPELAGPDITDWVQNAARLPSNQRPPPTGRACAHPRHPRRSSRRPATHTRTHRRRAELAAVPSRQPG